MGRRADTYSVYDYRTDVSAGLSTWVDDGDGTVSEPIECADPALSSLPDEGFVEGVVQLVLNTIEEPVPATVKQLWV